MGPSISQATQASAYVFPVASPLAKPSGPARGGTEHVRTISIRITRANEPHTFEVNP